MSTNSDIAIYKEGVNGGIYRGVYCHWDGYPSYNGEVLRTCYNTEEAVEKLISFGDMSALRERIVPNEGEKHTFDEPQENVTIYYHRDRGEEWERVKPFEAKTEAEYYKRCSQEYNYLFKDGKWYWNSYGERTESGEMLWK